MAANTTVCNDTSEAVELFKPLELFLKPIAKLTVCVQLPRLKEPGKSISNWEVMEKVKHMAKPHTFITIKIIKSTLEFIRLEGEAETKALMKIIIQRLDGKTIKLSGFSEVLKVKSAEAKVSFPAQHDWDSFFRDAKNMNEMKPGERPDTIHLKDLPTRWFASRHKEKDKPCEQTVKRVFQGFGEIRCLDIPMLDPYRKEMTSVKPGAIQTFNFTSDLTFDVFLQYKEYIGFVKAMDSLRGMKLLFVPEEEEEKAYTATIKVDFDKSKHLSDKAIKKRRLEREKLEQLEREREEKVRREREEEERRIEEERQKKLQEEREQERKKQEKIERRERRRKEREEKRRQKAIEKKHLEEERKYQLKIQIEERRFLIAQRKLESIRLLGELFARVKTIKVSEDLQREERELEEQRRKQLEMEQKLKEEMRQRKLEAKKQKKELMKQQEEELREKIIKKWKLKEEKREEEDRERLRRTIHGKNKLKSAAVIPSSSSRLEPGKTEGGKQSPLDWRKRGEKWIMEEYQSKILPNEPLPKKYKGIPKVDSPYKHFVKHGPHMEWKKRLKLKEQERKRWKEWSEWKKQFMYWKHKYAAPLPIID